MYRRRMKTNASGIGFNSDSLMDILACTIGLTIIIMLLAVMGAEKVAFSFTLPIMDVNTQDKSILHVLCLKGKVRVLDFAPALRVIRELPFQVEPGSFPVIAKLANEEEQVVDTWFKYSFGCGGNGVGAGAQSANLYIVVDEVREGSGEALSDLKAETSQFSSILRSSGVSDYWLMFYVDTASIELFREVRKMCLEQSYATGWQPSRITFPCRFSIASADHNQKILAPSLQRPQMGGN